MCKIAPTRRHVTHSCCLTFLVSKLCNLALEQMVEWLGPRGRRLNILCKIFRFWLKMGGFLAHILIGSFHPSDAQLLAVNAPPSSVETLFYQTQVSRGRAPCGGDVPESL